MKLLLINYEFPPLGGGAATATRELAESLCRQGCAVSVVTSKAKGEDDSRCDTPYKLHRLWTGRRRAESCSLFEMAMFVIVCSLYLPYLLLRERFDGAVLFFGLPCGWFGPLLKFGFGVPYVVSLRGGDVPGNEPSLNQIHHLLSPARRLIYQHSKCVTANSEGLKSKSLLVDSHPVTVIPNGVDCDRFTPIPPDSESENRILFVGRLVEQKNVPGLLKAFARVGGKAKLDIIGDGPLRLELHQLVKELQIEEKVDFHGWVSRDEITDYYLSATMLVLPSRYEGMSNVLLEGMAAGLPCIVTDVEGTRELIDHERNGLLVGLGDEEGLVRAMDRLLEDRDMRHTLGTNARSHVVENFSWDKAARSHLSIFES